MKYPAHFKPGDNGRFVVTFRDIPEAITQGDDEPDTLAMAADALVTAMEFYFEDRRPVPPPSPPLPGERLIALPLTISAKVHLLNQMIADRVRPADLARMMGVKPQEINRLTDLSHNTKIETVTAALRAMGREVELVVR